MTTVMTGRPRCCRNLASAFNAAATEAGIEPEATELSENRENLFVEELINGDRDSFKARWGYDPVADKPVEGSNWEYELMYPEPAPRPRQDEGTLEESNDVAVGKDVEVRAERGKADVEEDKEGTEDAK